VAAAAVLRGLGLRPGDVIAVAGYAHDAYYAQIAGVRVLAQVCDAKTYARIDWHDPQASCHARDVLLNPESAAPAWESLRRLGVKAVVTHDWRGDLPPSGWRRMGETRFWIRLL
jgi:hypothetical protein